MQFDIIVKGGRVASGHGAVRADLGISGGKVAVLATDLSAAQAGQTIDAGGKLLLPGIIDVHNHPVYDDEMTGMTTAGVFGGVTTVVPFTGAVKAWGFPQAPLAEVVRATIDDWSKRSLVDFGLHMVITRADDPVRDIPMAVELGVTSFKFFMAYLKRGMQIDDDKMIAAFDTVAQVGGMAMVHAEHGLGIDYLETKFAAQGNVDNGAYLRAHTDLLEAESVLRAIALADAVACPLYVVHLGVKEGFDVARLVRKNLSAPLFLETLYHYLLHTNEDVMKRGSLGKIGPPLRNTHDNEATWQALIDGEIDVIGTDHAGYKRANKVVDGQHILDAKYGIPGIEHLLPVTYSEAVSKGRIDLGHMVRLLCENPAKIFGLYPQKGVLAPGADADLVIFDENERWTITDENLHGNTDHSMYAGWEITGKPKLVMQRGQVLMENGNLKVQAGNGQFLPCRNPSYLSR
ncbi:MAG: amidohydrolase family protein [Chloroflexi bacterium]|nr:amidohydrolase family protein [Chloroflexota bacterium]